ncbi:MAG: hydantoinase B/oxoprolinase family protein [Ottowia sp.]|uniref:hydantoinase B/oxoprolinase family protein n=1 Tax=Ottowia sp. TaxID=1898956 RepID=UPI001B4A3584|nr:hydantoinase B/oxoprolinase family protein [Ottowia sp.]MBP7454781.1 hydantoinase B/oxoprolinase family protein [Ottowia sp.]MBP7457775.1 hydantoinase B/oxoprolinase family protein [Ottowia sp.]MBP8927522.1 hydantoinase B/oxoprolinase family protein [Ottowia sp.]MBP9670916.1 hydantoinase B/oxoprolinase family protein [Ottowia sp.]HRN06144.1 hydantoinase B/oxoprolinase family protein [Ottowia sp.]
MTNKSPSHARWQFWIDRGGTFTDIVARKPDGSIVTHKLLSENPEQYKDAAVAGIRHLLGLKAGEPVTPALVECVKMGTTVATNALLERKGEPTLLVTTRGFRDGLRIAYQNRPRLFDRHIVLPELLYSAVVEADERVDANGDLVRPLDEALLKKELLAQYQKGLRSVAIVFMHGYRHCAHEVAAARIAREVGFTQISTSHQTSPMMKFVSRGDTTVVDAYLSPILRRYVEQVAAEMPGVKLFFMQSSGGLTDAHAFQGKDAILSGPAGGIVGMARTAEIAGQPKVIGFDMGGTSTDVSHYAGAFEREFETQVAGVRMRAPMMSIHTVAAGGGSILQFDGARFRVGPESAGANPGPASYRRGGPLAVTDANVMVGKVQPAHFPKVFGRAANEALDADVVREKFTAIAQPTGRAPEDVAHGFIQIAVQQMANAIKKISVARGYDVTKYTLQCFGGAGGQHACGVADALGMTRVLVHPLAGVLSAYGMGLADQNVMRETAVELKLVPEHITALRDTLGELALAAQHELEKQEVSRGDIRVHRRVHVRYDGTDSALIVPFPHLQGGDVSNQAVMHEITQAFEAAYRQRFAFLMQGKALIVEAVSVEAVVAGDAPSERAHDMHPQRAVPQRDTVRMYTAGNDGQAAWHDAALIVREDLRPGDVIDGPAIIAEQNATTVVEPGWRASLTAFDHLVLERIAPRAIQFAAGTTVDPVLLEVFNNLFMNIAEQMGLQLQNTAYSVNIKERLDFSCALFDAEGNLIANAPHMPVHLGSMGESIKTVIRENAGQMQPGDVFVLNDPYHGGTHLPDVTVITPVYLDDGEQPIFYVGSRGHHADIGGISPGSMPPFSTRIEEEGVQIDNVKLVDRGHLREKEMLELLASGEYPSRNPQQNMADLKAQIAANEKGVQELRKMVDQFGLDVVQAYMKHVQDNAEESVRRAITKLAARMQGGQFTLPLDNGAQIQVAVTIDGAARSAKVDFTGTSPQQINNFNAPTAVCMAAVLYVFRMLVDDDIPLNAGCLKPIEVVIPEGSMLRPNPPASVVAGNVETSTCITNAIIGALGLMGASQCTVNNFTFGNDKYQYYETISGGSGAGGVFDDAGQLVGGFPGTSVVQTHMTNSRMTDPEVLEWRFPVRLESYEIRSDSGGKGQWNGGHGGVRRLRFLEPMTASILSNGRLRGAFGMAGGGAGAVGINRVVRASGTVQDLQHIGSAEMQPGDIFEIHTPGGGGFGAV